MFEKSFYLDIPYAIITSRDEQKFLSLEGAHMKNDISKDFVIKMMEKVDTSDKKFLLQLYTIIKRHLDKKGRR